MKITTAWCEYGQALIAAKIADGSTPAVKRHYEIAVNDHRSDECRVRELVIEVPDEAVRALFDVPEVEGKVTG